jgi:multiple sugar transport system permease protein
MPTVILLDGWKNVGFYVVIFLAGLQSIPKEYYEAVRVDGGTGWTTFRYVTLPLLAPIILFSVVICLIGASQVFDSIYVLTNGGPGDATRTVVMYLYQQGFQTFHMGYASSIALVLFLIVMALTALQFAVSRRWADQ